MSNYFVGSPLKHSFNINHDVSSWDERNLVQFNPLKTQVCALTTKKISFIVSPVFQNIPLTAAPSISILGLNVSSDCQYRDHLESKAKLALKKLEVINRAKRYFTPKHGLALYRAQVRPYMEYCSHLRAGPPQSA